METQKSNSTNSTMAMVCTGLFALAAVLSIIFAIIRITELNEYYSDSYESPGFVAVLFVIGLFAVAIGCGLTGFFIFTKQNAMIGYIVTAAGFALLLLQQLISMVQYVQIAYGYYYDGFWSYNIFTILQNLILVCVFAFYIILPSLTNVDKKSLGIVLMIVPAAAFIAVLIIGAGGDITLHPLQIVKTLVTCAAASSLPVALGYVNFGSQTAPQPIEPAAAAQQPAAQQPTIEQPAVQPPTIEQPAVQPPTIEQPAAQQPTVQPPAEAFEKLKMYKQLLDEGILNQEEFDILKKKLLNL